MTMQTARSYGDVKNTFNLRFIIEFSVIGVYCYYYYYYYYYYYIKAHLAHLSSIFAIKPIPQNRKENSDVQRLITVIHV